MHYPQTSHELFESLIPDVEPATVGEIAIEILPSGLFVWVLYDPNGERLFESPAAPPARIQGMLVSTSLLLRRELDARRSLAADQAHRN